MAKYTIKDLSEKDLSSGMLENYYSECKELISASNGEYPNFDFSDLDLIFKVASNNRTLFTAINAGENPIPKTYINRWILTYCNAIQDMPSKKIASPKISCNDPIIQTMIQLFQGIDDKEASAQISTHNLCMSAENRLGMLLEEFLATKLKPYGWIWCAGETLRAIDFCNKNGTILLQIKNKSNSENSSSSNIREGTSIKKWYRLGTSTRRGIKYPSFKWTKLNDIINETLPEGINPLNLDEKDFQIFIKEVVSSNNQLLTTK